MKDSWRAVGSLNVRTSLRIANWNGLEAVASVPAVLAVMVPVVAVRKASGVPTSCTVLESTFDSERPVPARPDALKVTAFRDAASALNWILDV
jgi:hypothetical protein